MSELKPCPFCGKPAKRGIHGSPFDWWVVCRNTKCGAEGPMRETKKDAKEAWNTRPEEAAAVADTKRRAVEIVRTRRAVPRSTNFPFREELAKAIEEMEP